MWTVMASETHIVWSEIERAVVIRECTRRRLQWVSTGRVPSETHPSGFVPGAIQLNFERRKRAQTRMSA